MKNVKRWTKMSNEELQVDELDYEFDDEPGTELEEDLDISALDSFESDDDTEIGRAHV